MRADNASVHPRKNARRTAYTAMTFKMTTADFIKDMATRPVRREQTTLPNVIAIDGGVPLKVGDDVIGGGRLFRPPRADAKPVVGGVQNGLGQPHGARGDHRLAARPCEGGPTHRSRIPI